jgi:hypothetical protein
MALRCAGLQIRVLRPTSNTSELGPKTMRVIEQSQEIIWRVSMSTISPFSVSWRLPASPWRACRSVWRTMCGFSPPMLGVVPLSSVLRTDWSFLGKLHWLERSSRRGVVAALSGAARVVVSSGCTCWRPRRLRGRLLRWGSTIRRSGASHPKSEIHVTHDGSVGFWWLPLRGLRRLAASRRPPFRCRPGLTLRRCPPGPLRRRGRRRGPLRQPGTSGPPGRSTTGHPPKPHRRGGPCLRRCRSR